MKNIRINGRSLPLTEWQVKSVCEQYTARRLPCDVAHFLEWATAEEKLQWGVCPTWTGYEPSKRLIAKALSWAEREWTVFAPSQTRGQVQAIVITMALDMGHQLGSDGFHDFIPPQTGWDHINTWITEAYSVIREKSIGLFGALCAAANLSPRNTRGRATLSSSRPSWRNWELLLQTLSTVCKRY